ncbi:MAG TPA: glycosyltransferase family 4 protein [Myxococcaceae bacterium]
MNASADTRPPVLLVTGDFVRTGGMDVANYGLAKYLARYGGPLHLVTHRVAPELAAFPNVHVHLVPRPGGSPFLGAPLLASTGRRWAGYVAAMGGRVIVNGGNCGAEDVNWVHYVHAVFQAPPEKKLLRRLKACAAGRVYRAQERERIRMAKVVIANSERTRKDLIERLDVRADLVKVVYYGTDPDQFRPGTFEERVDVRRELGAVESEPLVAFVGALGDRRKGFDVLFEAWSSLVQRGWDGLLVVIGRGAELEQWRARAEAARPAMRVRFLGFRSDVDRILRGCDALVAPTRYEAYGLGVHEALCCGVPALVSERAGVAEVYPKALKPLLIQDPESPAQVASALERWRNGELDWRARVLDLSKDLRTRSWEEMARNFVDTITG